MDDDTILRLLRTLRSALAHLAGRLPPAVRKEVIAHGMFEIAKLLAENKPISVELVYGNAVRTANRHKAKFHRGLLHILNEEATADQDRSELEELSATAPAATIEAIKILVHELTETETAILILESCPNDLSYLYSQYAVDPMAVHRVELAYNLGTRQERRSRFKEIKMKARKILTTLTAVAFAILFLALSSGIALASLQVTGG